MKESLALDVKHKIVIFGTGGQAIRDYYNLRDKYEIMWFLDNNKGNDYFMGKSIKIPNGTNIHTYFIAVCTNDNHYMEIAEQLKAYGLKEFKDFCPGGALEERKIVLVHGNCHMAILKKYMMTSDSFRRRYYIYPMPVIHKMKQNHIDEDVLRNCDVFIHQDIRKDNALGYQFSDDYTVPRLKKDCINIAVPNLYTFGKVFFPQMIRNTNNHQFYNDENGMFPLGDMNVDKLLENGIQNIDQIIQTIEGEYYNSDFIKQRFQKYANEMLEREKYWDIKIMDYILANFKRKKLFYDFRHPCNDVIREICKGVFKLLNVDCQSIQEIDENLGRYEEPVYPCIIRVLGLQWGNDNLRKDGYKLTDGKMDFKEYYREYLYWSFGI